MLISLLLVPLTIDYLNPTQYGIWITLMSVIAWFNFFDIGLGNGLRNKFATAKAENKEHDGAYGVEVFERIEAQAAERLGCRITHKIGYPAMRQLMKNDGIQERYGDEDERKRIFKQQIEQAHELSPPDSTL